MDKSDNIYIRVISLRLLNRCVELANAQTRNISLLLRNVKIHRWDEIHSAPTRNKVRNPDENQTNIYLANRPHSFIVEIVHK